MAEPSSNLSEESGLDKARTTRSSREKFEYIFFAGVLPVIVIVLMFLGHAGFSALFVPLVCLSILALRDGHADDVYLLLVIFFSVIYVCLVAFFYLDPKGYIYSSFFDPVVLGNKDKGGIIKSAFNWYIAVSSDIVSELLFLGMIMGLVVIPQLLSLVFGGLFGCGRQPEFISRVTKFATLSLIKLFCVSSGIEMARFLFTYYLGVTYDHSLMYIHLDNSLISLGYSFAAALLYFKLGKLFMFKRDRTGIVDKILIHMTRFTTQSGG